MDSSIGRPERDEAIEYYHPYIDLVPDGDIRLTLDVQKQETLSFLGSIPEALATHRYAPEKWSVSEVVGHVNDCERLYTMRAFWFARAMDAPLPSFHSDLAVKTSGSADRSLSSLVEELASIRASSIDLFRNLPPEAWLRRGVASDYQFSVRALAYITAGHVLHHTQILKARYL
ncbi:MAG: DinB family protein [Acidobacteriota bacterium]|nr:DinB family protein [Acidobacteriota bacterium]